MKEKKIIEEFKKAYYENFISERLPWLLENMEIDGDLDEDGERAFMEIFMDGVIVILGVLFDRNQEQVTNDIALELSLRG